MTKCKSAELQQSKTQQINKLSNPCLFLITDMILYFRRDILGFDIEFFIQPKYGNKV